jgi:hypothetical protein
MWAPEERTSSASCPRFSGIGSGSRGKAAVGLEVDADDGAAEPFQEKGDDGATGAPDAVERHREPGPPDQVRIHLGQREHQVQVPPDRVGVEAQRAQSIPSRPTRTGLGEGPDRGARGRIEEDAIGTHQLERVPLDRGCGWR